MKTIGIKNNNPFNIRKSGTKWIGKVSSDNAFECFCAMYYGCRAAYIILRTYYKKYHLNTIEGIINRFAPALENDTENYIHYVCFETQIKRDDKLTLSQIYFHVAPAMARLESGYHIPMYLRCQLNNELNK